jgi:hypothetical protein
MEDSEIDFKPADLIYCGRRYRDKELSACILRLDENGEILVGEGWYTFSKYWKNRVVGGVYTGASFSPTKIRGFNTLQYLRHWPDKDARIEWQARDMSAGAEAKADAMEEKLRKENDLRDVMLPLRRRYAAMQKRHDLSGMYALERAVNLTLRTPILASEKED